MKGPHSGALSLLHPERVVRCIFNEIPVISVEVPENRVLTKYESVDLK